MTQSFHDVAQLEDLLSEPGPGAIAAMRRIEGDLLLLGVAGKMGPTLARMAQRASDAAGGRRRIIGVSRFSEVGEQQKLHAHGVETIRCDLLDEDAVAKLPEAPNVICMAGMKFGATGQAALTWAMNAWLPALVCRQFRQSRIVAFSTGNVYGLVPVAGGGSVETDALTPVGEYAMSCLGRERMFEHFSRAWGLPTALIRLNYACELRYGVLVDLARQVWAGEPVDLAMGYFNCLWQGDANDQTLQCFAQVATPPCVLNVTGPERLSVRHVCEGFAARLGRDAAFTGTESASALLSNAQRSLRLFGPPRVGVERLMDWIADWVRRGGASLGKPTHFAARDGRF